MPSDWSPTKSYSLGDRVLYENVVYDSTQPSYNRQPDISKAHSQDNYTNDAALLEVDFHHQIDALGSRQEILK